MYLKNYFNLFESWHFHIYRGGGGEVRFVKNAFFDMLVKAMIN